MLRLGWGFAQLCCVLGLRAAFSCDIDEIADRVESAYPATFEPEHLVNVRLRTRLTPQVRSQLEASGLKIRGEDGPRVEIVGEAPAESLLTLSRLPAVKELTRGHASGEFEVIRGGRSWFRKEPTPRFSDSTEAAVWHSMPPLTRPAPSIAQTRKAAQAGITLVVEDHAPPSIRERRNRERLAGAKIFYAGDLDEGHTVVELPGLVLHLGATSKVFRVRGEANPLLGAGPKRVIRDKVEEMLWLNEVAPRGTVPRSLRAEKLGSSRLRREVNDYLSRKADRLPAATVRELASLVDAVLAKYKAQLGGELVLKYADARSTGDYGDVLLTPEVTGETLVRDALEALAGVRRSYPKGMELASVDLLAALEEAGAPQAPYILRGLLFEAEKVLFQERLAIRRLEGREVEFRVDVVGGEIAHSRIRYGFQILPREQERAAATVRRLLEALPEREARSFSGGVDVCQLEDGSFRILETNAANESGFLYAYLEPASANQALSQISGRQTPLTQDFERAVAGSLPEQVTYLKQYSLRWRDEYATPHQTPRAEWFYQIAHRRCSQWDRRNASEGRRILRDLERLAELSDLASNSAASETLASARRHLTGP